MPGSPPQVPIQILERFFEEPGGHIVLDRDLRVVEVGPEYLRLTMNRREGLLGQSYINTITEPNPTRHEFAVDSIRRMCAAALKTNQVQKYPPLRMDIKSTNGEIQERWWQGAYIPVSVNDGQVEYIVHRLEDITVIKVMERKLGAVRRSNYILYGLVLLALGVGSWLATQKSDTNHRIAISGKVLAVQTCDQVQRINSRIYEIINTQLHSIETPGTATYRFYQEHPGLAISAKQQTTKELQLFLPKKCK